MHDITDMAQSTVQIADLTNIVGGAVIGFLSLVFGPHWILFAGFLLLNIVDFITGCYKARLNKELSSAAGFNGAMRKVFYWVVIAIAFFTSHSFVEMGNIIGVKLDFVVLFGWLTLATYLVNEMRSILENFVEIGVEVPEFLINGLNVTKKLMEAKERADGTNQNEDSKSK